ncbi:MAG: hypothetical protein Fur0015_13540 [Ignavibacteriales bacterium]
MKTTLILFFSIVLAFSWNAELRSQIPNPGFEQWSGNTPSEWSTGNVEGFVFVRASTDPMSGQFAARLEAKSILNNLVPAVLSSGQEGNGFPVSQRHGQLSLYYKFHKTVNTAYLFISVGFKKGENGIGAGVLAINEPADNYTPITIPVTYINDEIPDLGEILIQVTDQNLNPAASGSYAEIDNLSFSILSDVDNEANVNSFSLDQNYPNPFNPVTSINYQLAKSENVLLKVYDIIGNEVALIVNERQPAGKHSVTFDASILSSGIYLYRLQAGSFVQIRKMTLLK